MEGQSRWRLSSGISKGSHERSPGALCYLIYLWHLHDKKWPWHPFFYIPLKIVCSQWSSWRNSLFAKAFTSCSQGSSNGKSSYSRADSLQFTQSLQYENETSNDLQGLCIHLMSIRWVDLPPPELLPAQTIYVAEYVCSDQLPFCRHKYEGKNTLLLQSPLKSAERLLMFTGRLWLWLKG